MRVVFAPVGVSSVRLATQGSLTCICMHYSDIPDVEVELTVHVNRSEVRRQCWPDAKARYIDSYSSINKSVLFFSVKDVSVS